MKESISSSIDDNLLPEVLVLGKPDELAPVDQSDSNSKDKKELVIWVWKH